VLICDDRLQASKKMSQIMSYGHSFLLNSGPASGRATASRACWWSVQWIVSLVGRSEVDLRCSGSSSENAGSF